MQPRRRWCDDLWCELHRDGRDWMHSSWDEFTRQLPDEIKRFVGAQRAEGHIVVYGNTQVGKTTLMLRLLGVKETHMERVGQVLRGHRSQGHSATAVAMHYARSVDTCWRYHAPDSTQESHTDETISTLLKTLRDRMENGQIEFSDPVAIKIPSDCFDDDAQPMKLMDLPGVQSLGEREAALARSLATRYLPIADLILIVAKIEDMSTLTPENIAKTSGYDSMRYWTSFPHKLGIVLTRVAQDKTIQDWIRQHDSPISVTELRQLIFDQLSGAASFFETSEELRSRIYPLDIGDSWEAIKNKHELRDIWNKTDGAFSQVIADIRREIECSADIDRRMQSIVGIQRALKEIIKSKKEGFNKSQSELNKLLSNRSSDIKLCKNRLTGLQKERTNLESLKLPADRAYTAAGIIHNYKEKFMRKHLDRNDKDSFRVFLLSVRDEMKSAVRRIESEMEIPLDAATVKRLIDNLEGRFDDCRQEIEADYPYFINFINGSAKKNRLYDRTVNVVFYAWDDLRSDISKIIASIDNNHNQRLQDEINNIAREINRFNDDVFRISAELDGLAYDFRLSKEAIINELEDLYKALSYSEGFDKYIQQAFRKQLKYDLELMYTSPRHDGKFIRALALLHSIRDYQKLTLQTH